MLRFAGFDLTSLVSFSLHLSPAGALRRVRVCWGGDGPGCGRRAGRRLRRWTADVLLEAATRLAFESVLLVRRFASCRGQKGRPRSARVLAARTRSWPNPPLSSTSRGGPRPSATAPLSGKMGPVDEPGGPPSVPSCPYRSDGADPALLEDLAQDTDGIESAGESRVRDGLDDRLDHLPR